MLNVNFNPFPLLKTERCILRRIALIDKMDLFELRSNKIVLKHLYREEEKSVEEIEDLIRMYDQLIAANEKIIWAITLKNEDKLIGTIGYRNLIKEHYRAEFGYSLLPIFHRQGIMNEVIKRVMDYSFNELGLHSLEASIAPENDASINLLVKNGFVKEAYFKENYCFRGIFIDSVIYSKLNTTT